MSKPTVEQVASRVYHNTNCPPMVQARAAARAVLALFEPETVSSVAELDALPVGSVVLDADGKAWQKIGFDVGEVWASWGRRRMTENQIAHLPPAAVVYRPEEDR